MEPGQLRLRRQQAALLPAEVRRAGVPRPLLTLQPCLVPSRVASDEADVVAQVFVPARTGFAVAVAGGVPAEAGDFGVGVAGVGPDGDPATFAFFAPLGHRSGGKGAFEELAAVEGEADGAGAVVAAVPPAGVAAAPDVRFAADLVGGGDYRLDPGGSALRRDQHPVVEQLRLRGRRADVDFGWRHAAGGATGRSARSEKSGGDEGD